MFVNRWGLSHRLPSYVYAYIYMSYAYNGNHPNQHPFLLDLTCTPSSSARIWTYMTYIFYIHVYLYISVLPLPPHEKLLASGELLVRCINASVYTPPESHLSFSYIFSLLLFHLASPYASIFCDFVLIKSRVIWWASVMRWLGPNCCGVDLKRIDMY